MPIIGAATGSGRLPVKSLRRDSLKLCAVLAAVLLLLAENARAASVGPTGYTNDFGSQPLAADWATFSALGTSDANYDSDSDVNINITASSVTVQTTSSTGNPPSASGTATWSSTGLYLQTRPTGNRYTSLMGKFVNNTGTNATQIRISYLLTIMGAVGSEDAGFGTKVYYSVTGAANSWNNLASLNTLSTSGSSLVGTNLALNWTNGGSLYLLWIDDNAMQGTDPAQMLDNFSLQVTVGTPLVLASTLTAPSNTAVFASSSSIEATATAISGTGPYTIEYFTNGGSGTVVFASAGSSGTPPYSVDLGRFAAGTYMIYAVAVDSATTPATVTTATNTFLVADPLSVALAAPADNATFDHATPVSGSVTVFGGTSPYSVQFYLDNVPTDGLVTAVPYDHDFGPLFVGDHTIRATITDARGWVSNSVMHTVHITGPLGVVLTPTNGTAYNYGQSVILQAAPGGGTAPYVVALYTNGHAVGSFNSPPFTTNLGLLPVGSYTSYVHVADSSSPTAQQADSTTNILTILPNPLLVDLTSPINGLRVTAGQPLVLEANVIVGPPVTVTDVELFLNGASVGVDVAAPYSVSVLSPAAGNHTVYAAATDSLGRKNYSATNQITAVSGAPGSNDHFTNAIPLSGLNVTTTGINVGATRESGEPSHGGFGGTHSVWWTWMALDNGLTTVDTFGSFFDTLLGVYVGNAVNELTLIADNDDYFSGGFFSAQSQVRFNATAGSVYRIAVDGFAGSSGNITLHIYGPNGVSISSPTNGAVVTLGDPIPFNVTISSNFPSPPATRVDFYRGGVLFGSSTNAPFTAIATNLPLGTNSFYAVAIGSTSQSYTSATINVFVQNVGVTLLLPLDGSYLNFGSTNPIPVTAWAYLPVGFGSITNIEFYVDGQKFGEDATPPYRAVWSNPVGGSHRLTAIGRADTGVAYNSQPVNIAVYRTLVPVGAVWKYLDDGSNQGTNWIAPNFDDSHWAKGPSPLGYNDSNGRFPATTNSFGPDSNNKYVTTYYRESVVITNLASYLAFYMYLQRDDGIVVYVNGVEVYRNNMPSGGIASGTFASAIASDDGGSTFFVAPGLHLFGEGTNVLAAEVHQNVANTPDSWFQLEFFGAPILIRNLYPAVAVTSPTNNAYYFAPSEIALAATASDADGSVAKVEFFAGTVKIGEDTEAPYEAVWGNPPVAAHRLTAVATDDQGATTTSDEIPIVVYDAEGHPVAALTSPADGATMGGPTNLVVRATANAITGVTNVQFLADGVAFGNDDTAPYSAVWTAPFGTSVLTAIAFDATGASGTSPPISVTITIPPTNVVAPVVTAQSPPAGASLTNLTSITVTFSEFVQNIDAADLLINGVPATGVNANHSRSNYTFTFPQPPYGPLNITWAGGHGIQDFGFPASLPFDENGMGATWTYELIDLISPYIALRSPAPGSTVTNLTAINVTFSEAVTGVDAADLVINGTPALSVSGSGASYTFDLPRFSTGLLNVSWSTTNNIFDLAVTPNPFIRSFASNIWNFTLDTRRIYIQTNTSWLFIKGLAEASDPTNAWRQLAYDDAGWSNAPTPFFYGETALTNASYRGTTLSDMQSNYTSIYLRREFTVENRGNLTNLLLYAQADDGFVAWINGVQMVRFNAPAGEVPYNAVATAQSTEPNNNGAAWVVYQMPGSAAALVDGRNVLAVQALNQNLTNSSDFSFNAQLYAYPQDPSTVAPRLLTPVPAQGDTFHLTNVLITFSEGVTGVDATDMLVNGVPAESVTSETNTTYLFRFAQPAYGPVLITWDNNSGIVDFDGPPKAFNGTSTNATLRYFLINPSNPTITAQVPIAGSSVTGLTQVVVTFSEPVSGVEAADLLLNGTPALSMNSADNITYQFAVTQPAYGAVAVRWATNHGIVDVEAGNAFDPTRFGGQWSYTLIDPVPSVTITSPTNNTSFLPPVTLTVRATASDNDGTVALVELYEGDNKLGESNGVPYAVAVSNLGLGTYRFRAVATDNIGLSRTSAPVVINVTTSLPIALVRGPYLNSGSPTGGVVRWRTDVISDGLVYYGTDLNNLTNFARETAVTNEHIVTLTGLEPDTKYFYSIGSSAYRLVGGTNDGASYWFETSPPVGTRRPTRLWILGDAGTAGNGAPDRQQSTRDAFHNFAATNGQPDLWLMLGDNAYNSGTDTEHQAAVFDMYPTTLRNKFLWPTLGNHETAQSTTATDFPYLHIFTLPKNGEAGGVPSGSEKYYSFDYANIHFVCLDSMTSGQGANTPMANWLRADLEASSQEWIIVFFHHPPYTKGSHNSDTEQDLVAIRQNLVPILEDYGVDLVLCGHSHAYERSFLMRGHYGLSPTITSAMKLNPGDGREDGDGAYHKNHTGEGTVYTVAGSSGQATFATTPDQTFTTTNHPAMFLSLLELGSMVVDVSSNRLDALFLRETGEIQDRFTITKPPPFTAAPLNLLALPTGPAEITLSWSPGAGNQRGFFVERSVDGLNFALWQTTTSDVTTLVDGGLTPSATYFYRVRATNTFGVSEFSNIASATAVTPTAPPQAPAALVVRADDGVNFYRSQLILNWQDRSADEGAFQIERSLDGASFEVAATVGANITHYTDYKLSSGTAHYYRIRAVNSLGVSAPSSPAGEVTHPQSQLVLSGVSATFHAGIEGSPAVRYQWLYAGTALPGQTNETLVLNNVQYSNEGNYSVSITDGDLTSESNPAYLFVLAPPSFVTPLPDTAGAVGTTVRLEANVEGTPPLFFQWRKNGVLLPGANGSVLAFTPAEWSDQGHYEVRVENQFGAITSRVARLELFDAPILATVPDTVIEVLQTLIISNSVTDPNQPPLQHTYALASGAPTNAVIDPVTGIFTWKPNRSQAPSTNIITVQVFDETRPAVGNSTSFTVVVKDFIEVTVGRTILQTGETNFVPLTLFSSAPLEDAQYALRFPPSHLTNLAVQALTQNIATASLSLTDSETAAVSFTATAGNTLQGTQQLANLRFEAVPGQLSAFAPLQLLSVSYTPTQAGLDPTILVNDGRAVVIGQGALLEPVITNSPVRRLVIYIRPGTPYTLEYSTNTANPAGWRVLTTVPASPTLFRSLPLGTTPAPPIYYRVRQ